MPQNYDPRWVEAFKMISDGVFGDTEYFEDMVASVNDIPARGNDWFLLANDFASYMDAQARVIAAVFVFASAKVKLEVSQGHHETQAWARPDSRSSLYQLVAAHTCGTSSPHSPVMAWCCYHKA